MLEVVLTVIQAVKEMLEKFHPLRYLFVATYRRETNARWKTEKPIIIFANALGAVLVIVLVVILGYVIAKKI